MHNICTGGCRGVSEEAGDCNTEDCKRFGQALKDCDCEDGKHKGEHDVAEGEADKDEK